MIELDQTPPYFADKQDLVNEILARYPVTGRRSALMPLLWEVQRAERHVSEARIHEIAEIVGLTATEVKGVMSFYSTYHEHPLGTYHLQVCSTLSCALAGSDELYDFLVEELGIVNGERDREGRFSIQKVECLGSCGTAPVLQVNDSYYERVGRSRCQRLIDAMRRDELPEPWRERGGDNEGPEKARPYAENASVSSTTAGAPGGSAASSDTADAADAQPAEAAKGEEDERG